MIQEPPKYPARIAAIPSMKLGPLLFLLYLIILNGSTPGQAQRSKTLTLDQIINRLDANLAQYESTVPNLFCDEHAVSERFPARNSQIRTTDSVFRLNRVPQTDGTATIEESREVKTINGRPARPDDDAIPAIVHGAFSGGLAAVSNSQKSCMNYTLRPRRPDRPNSPYIIQFKSVYDEKHPAKCLLQEEGSGQIIIDPVSLQATRMELTAPQHVIFPEAHRPNGQFIPQIVGEWQFAVDYAPVSLGGQTFWIPATVTSNATAATGGAEATVWTFKAHYSNYHELKVKSRVLSIENSGAH